MVDIDTAAAITTARRRAKVFIKDLIWVFAGYAGVTLLMGIADFKTPSNDLRRGRKPEFGHGCGGLSVHDGAAAAQCRTAALAPVTRGWARS
ncbi:hypothetical protein GCM10028793_07830 [Nocardiopsis oceani]